MTEQRLVNLYRVVNAVSAALFVLYFYGQFVWSPNQTIFDGYNDGLNQYYSFTYFINHNPNYIDNEGLNYPYGEHYVYSDGQPFFAYLFKWLNGYFPVIGDHTVGIINLLMMLGLFLTPIILFEILDKLKVRPLLAYLGAMGITFLEPQVYRLIAHFSLSYSCCLPLTIYLNLQLFLQEGKRKNKWVALLAFNNLFWLFTHPYIGLAVNLLSAALWGIHWLWHFKTLAKVWKGYLIPVLVLGFPIGFFRLFLSLTDEHPLKTSDVYGLLQFCGEPDDVFVPNCPPLAPIINQFVEIKHTHEGLAYVGVTTTLVLASVVLLAFIRLLTRSQSPLKEPVALPVWIGLFTAIPFLLWSWAFPFKQFPVLIEWLPILKQFRAVGRFAWIFYYIATLFSVYMIHRAVLVLELKKYKILAWSLLIVGPLLYMVEGYPQHMKIATHRGITKSFFHEEHRWEFYKEALSKIDVNDYQAIVPLPLYYYGSMNFFRPLYGASTQISKTLSAITGLPIIGAAVARGDLNESRNIVQVVSPSYYPRAIEQDIADDRPFLLTKSVKADRTNQYEDEILSRATLIATEGNGKHHRSLYAITKEALFYNSSQEVIDRFNSLKENLVEREDGWYVSDSTTFLMVEEFEDRTTEIHYQGQGAFAGEKKDYHELMTLDFSEGQRVAGQQFTANMWVYNGAMDAVNFFAVAVHVVNNDGTVVHPAIGWTRPDIANCINGNWTLAEMSFVIPATFNPAQQKIKVVKHVAMHGNHPVYIDNVLVHSSGKDVYKIIKSDAQGIKELTFNNHQIVRPTK